MKSLVILANGAFPSSEKTLKLLSEAEVTICCDGAAVNLLEYGKIPDAIVGDIDSIPQNIIEQFENIIHRNSEQETNDLTKAFNLALSFVQKREIEIIHILGATGLREDHTLGNISLLAEYGEISPCPIDLVTDFGRAVAIYNTQEIEGEIGQTVSIFAFDNSLKITSEGLVYPTNNVKFNSLWPATLNRVEKTPFKLTFSHPAKSIIYFAD